MSEANDIIGSPVLWMAIMDCNVSIGELVVELQKSGVAGRSIETTIAKLLIQKIVYMCKIIIPVHIVHVQYHFLTIF